jgi:hypothetical protein
VPFRPSLELPMLCTSLLRLAVCRLGDDEIKLMTTLELLK